MSNARLKLVGKLAHKKFRNELGLFVAEGLRLCEEVPPAQIEFGFYTREFLLEERARLLVERLKNFGITVMAATSERTTHEETLPDGTARQISTFHFVRFRKY